MLKDLQAGSRVPQPVKTPSSRLLKFLPALPATPARSYLNDNFLSGALPDTWSSPGAFPELSLLRIDGNALTGMLPPALGSAGPGGSRSGANMPNLLVL